MTYVLISNDTTLKEIRHLLLFMTRIIHIYSVFDIDIPIYFHSHISKSLTKYLYNSPQTSERDP